MEKKKGANEKAILGKFLEFGIRMKLHPEDMYLYYLAQRGNLLYVKLQDMHSSEKSTFDHKVQELFTTMTNEIERMVNFSQHLPFIMEEEKEKIQWKIFDAERENRIYYYLRKIDEQARQDFDRQLDDLSCKLWNSYHHYLKSTQEISDLESELFYKLEYVIILTKNSREGSSERKKGDRYKKNISLGFLILYAILATIYIINGLLSKNGWDLAIGFAILISGVVSEYAKYTRHDLLISSIAIATYFFLQGAQFISEGNDLMGQILVVLAVINVVGGTILDTKIR